MTPRMIHIRATLDTPRDDIILLQSGFHLQYIAPLINAISSLLKPCISLEHVELILIFCLSLVITKIKTCMCSNSFVLIVFIHCTRFYLWQRHYFWTDFSEKKNCTVKQLCASMLLSVHQVAMQNVYLRLKFCQRLGKTHP